jgi:hypothetical protein
MKAHQSLLRETIENSIGLDVSAEKLNSHTNRAGYV